MTNERVKELLKQQAEYLIESIDANDEDKIVSHWHQLADWWHMGVSEIDS